MAQEIKILSNIEHLRSRPEMYIGTVEYPDTIYRELIDNAVDECLNEYSDSLEVEYGKDYATVTDSGNGLPQQVITAPNGKTAPAVELLCTELFSGGKFNQSNYKISSGLHGVGLTAANALSELMLIDTCDRENHYTAKFSRGELIEWHQEPCDKDTHYTKVTIYPDKEIFGSVKPRIPEIKLKSIKTQLGDKILVKLNGNVVTPLVFEDIFADTMLYESAACSKVTTEEAELITYINWTKASSDCSIVGYINGIEVNKGLIASELKDYVVNKLESKSGISYAHYGLRILYWAKLPDARYSSQSKERITKSESFMKLIKSNKIYESLLNFDLELLRTKLLAYASMMTKLSTKNFIDLHIKKSSKLSRSVVQGIYDCSSKSREGTELFIVEGKSAASGLLATRDIKRHAVLPLRGKTLNVCAGARDDYSMITNREIKALLNSIGVGVAPYEDLSGVRYSKIIIETDADPDGYNIESLIIGAMVKFTPELVKAGYVYVLRTPLYKQGDKYYYTEEGVDFKRTFSRFKGLGEMNPKQLAEVSFNEKSRVLDQLVLNEITKEKVELLIGNTDYRREFLIQRGCIDP